MELSIKRYATVFKALGDENRVKILLLLQKGEICACKLLEALNISQPTLSHHMKLLCDAEIVTCRKEGKWSYYTISEIGLNTLIDFLESLNNIEEKRDICCE